MSDTRAIVLEMLAESGLDGDGCDELVSCLDELGLYLDDSAPEPSPELAALLANPAQAPAAPGRKVVPGGFGRKRARLFVAGAAALGAVGAGGIAAAANELPSGAQTIVAEFSERFLPFALPHPDGSRVPHTEPTESEPTTVPEDEPLRREAVDDGAPAATTELGTTTAPTAVATTEPSPPGPTETASVAPSEDAATGSGSALPSSSASEPSPGEPSQESGSPQAGGEATTSPDLAETSPAEPSEPAGEPSGSSSPTANTRTEVTDEPSPSPSPATSPSPSPSVTASPSTTSSPSTAVWSDTD